MPKIQWEMLDSESDVSIVEGEEKTFCFSSEIPSAVSYQVEVGVRPKGDRVASGKHNTPILCVIPYNII